MKSIIVVAGVLLLVSTSLASCSVKLPEGSVIPEGAVLNGKNLYYTLANSLNTLPLSADLSQIATVPSAHVSTLIGSSAQQRVSLVVVPEKLAPKDSVNAVEDNAFALDEMSRTFSTALVMPGASSEMRNAFAPRMYRKIDTPYMEVFSLSSTLQFYGVNLNSYVKDDKFTLNGAEFDISEINEILATAAAFCSSERNEQVTVVDFRATYEYAVEKYGAESAQVNAVAAMINSIISDGQTMVYVLATNANFFENQAPAYGFVAVHPSVTPVTPNPGKTKPGNKDTGNFQITLWFTIGISLVLLTFAVLTCGVGVDIEKDTLLYQTTCLRGQPVF